MNTRGSCAAMIVLSLIAAGSASAQTRSGGGTTAGEWPAYGGDLGPHALRAARANRREQLRLARDRVALQRRESRPDSRDALAEHAARRRRRAVHDGRHAARRHGARMPRPASSSGSTAWTKARAAPRRRAKLSGRGLAFWQRGNDKRVVYVTPGYQLVALNAATGRPVESFGDGGIVDLKASLDQGDDWDRTQIGTNSPPTIAATSILVPAAHTPLAPPNQAKNVVGLHPRLRRRDGQAAVDVSHRARGLASPATRRGSTVRRARAAATPASGPRSRPTSSSGSRICPSNRRTATCTGACVPARISTARASSPSTSAPANAAGIFRRRIIRCGITTCRRRRSWSTRSRTGERSRRSRRRRSRDCCSC